MQGSSLSLPVEKYQKLLSVGGDAAPSAGLQSNKPSGNQHLPLTESPQLLCDQTSTQVQLYNELF